jgi:hypothetical protein
VQDIKFQHLKELFYQFFDVVDSIVNRDQFLVPQGSEGLEFLEQG